MNITIETPGYRTRNDYFMNYIEGSSLIDLPNACYNVGMDHTIKYNINMNNIITLAGSTTLSQSISNAYGLFSLTSIINPDIEYYLNYCLVTGYTSATNFVTANVIYSFFGGHDIYYIGSDGMDIGTVLEFYLQLVPFSFFKMSE